MYQLHSKEARTTFVFIDTIIYTKYVYDKDFSGKNTK